MTIQSMTAFARCESQGDWGNAVCEIRSINHRYLEISPHLSDALRTFEMALRERIKQAVSRGKIELSIRYQSQSNGESKFIINKVLVKQVSQAIDKVNKLLKKPAATNAIDILHWSGVMETKETDSEKLELEIFSLLDCTIKELIAARKREGKELKRLFLQRIALLNSELKKVRQQLPSILAHQRENLFNRFTEAKLELNPERVEQEMVIFAQRIDIAEEIERTETHLNEFERIIQEGGAVGRRLDFLLQELNREANTMGSKSVDSIVTHAAIEMKVLIEQIREQVQNVE